MTEAQVRPETDPSWRFGSLAGRLQLLIAAALAPLAILLTAAHVEGMHGALTEEYRARAAALAQSLASSAAPGVEPRDLARLQRAVDETSKGADLVYAYVTNERGELLARAVAGGASAELPKAPAGGDPAERVREVEFGGVQAIDAAAPVPGTAVAAHVGLDLRPVDDRIRRAATTSAALSIAILLAALFAARTYARRLSEPMKRLTATATQIATTGDLTIPIAADGTDEIAALAKSLVAVIERLRAMATSVHTALTDIDQSVNSFSAVSMQQATALQRQAAALTETNTTTQEIKQTSAISATKAEEVLEIARRAEEVATRGRASVDSSAAGMQEVQEQVKAITGRIRGLIEKTLAVSEITDTVGDLAEQSNVLAINAAIEAVKAGEAGRGFGVVAREIRGLADQSMQATARVRALIAEIQRAIHATVLIIEEGNQRVDAGLGQVHSSGESLRDLTETVRDTSRAAKEIARSVSQQNVGIEQIFGALVDLERLMNESVSGIEDVAAGGEAVRQVSSKLRTLAEAYRV